MWPQGSTGGDVISVPESPARNYNFALTREVTRWSPRPGQRPAGRVKAKLTPAGRHDNLDTVIPLRFEAGEAIGQVAFDEDGKVAGLWLRP